KSHCGRYFERGSDIARRGKKSGQVAKSAAANRKESGTVFIPNRFLTRSMSLVHAINSLCAIFDLVSIGDDTCIGAETQLLGYMVEAVLLSTARTDTGSRWSMGTHSALAINPKMEAASSLDDMSLRPEGAVMKSKEARRGSPAEPAKVNLPCINEERAW